MLTNPLKTRWKIMVYDYYEAVCIGNRKELKLSMSCHMSL